jgi:catechol-2,3-dioxygenase
MKKILGLLFLIVATAAMATDFPLAWANNTINSTLLSATTNATGSAIFVESVKYHTFVIVNATVRTNLVTIQGSLNGTNYVTLNLTTNTVVSTNAVTMTGKYSYIQAQVSGLTGTDCNTTVQYLGGN